ncbi:RidA family protein [Peribacillus cavernae]|uniref:RidA family protein n=1 Tax=Peribacillus cavernae TaxID=1674310 RepID=A0A3S1B7X2_9BACI|nr:RidA family protein [Peribacillus cavernae]MDQ0217406.1 enamine deaminase RidA (YjgF/YER057c/UK114 family) [Peribacillus cavernae]RUQ30146.1 RidA family protein [Peribacillus cavernae]
MEETKIIEKKRLMPKDHWDWSMPVPFSQGWKVGNLIFVGGQVSVDKNCKVIGVDDIEVQTRNVFENIRKVLNEAGADMKDLVKFNTFYTFEGDKEEVTEFWQKMTKVRLEYLTDPGPCGTALRVSGFGTENLLIEVEGIAVVDE